MKNNFDLLRDVLKEIAKSSPQLASKAGNIVSDIEKEFYNNEDVSGFTCDNSNFVGLDMILWSLQKRNMVIETKMQGFVKQLQREYTVAPE